MNRNAKTVQLRINVDPELAGEIICKAETTGLDQFDVVREAIQLGLHSVGASPKKPKSQTEVAREAGVSRSYLSHILAGRRRASIDVAERLARVTGKHVLYWLDPGKYLEDGEPNPGAAPHGQD